MALYMIFSPAGREYICHSAKSPRYGTAGFLFAEIPILSYFILSYDKEELPMITKIKETTSIKLQVVADVKNGKETYATVTFSGINKSLSDDDINELGNGIAELQERPLSNLTRLDSAQLLNG